MPNECDNRLIVTGPAEERQRLVRLWTDGEWVFQKIVPQPDRFTDDDVAEICAKANDLGLTVGVERNSRNIWRLWREIHWGTKWDVNDGYNRAVVEEQEDEAMIYFRSAWTPPVPVVKAMSALYPDLEFKLTYFEGSFGGEARYVGGNGQDRWYGHDDPEYQRIARDFGWEEDEDEEEDEE